MEERGHGGVEAVWLDDLLDLNSFVEAHFLDGEIGGEELEFAGEGDIMVVLFIQDAAKQGAQVSDHEICLLRVFVNQG